MEAVGAATTSRVSTRHGKGVRLMDYLSYRRTAARGLGNSPPVSGKQAMVRSLEQELDEEHEPADTTSATPLTLMGESTPATSHDIHAVWDKREYVHPDPPAPQNQQLGGIQVPAATGHVGFLPHQ